MDYQGWSTLKNLDKPFDPNEKMQGLNEYGTLYPSDDKHMYQQALYGKGITEPTFVGIPFRSTCYQQLCVLPKKKENISRVSYENSKPIFNEFDVGMLIYRKGNK